MRKTIQGQCAVIIIIMKKKNKDFAKKINNNNKKKTKMQKMRLRIKQRGKVIDRLASASRGRDVGMAKMCPVENEQRCRTVTSRRL